MKKIIVCSLLFFVSGCTHYSYQGNIEVADSSGVDRDVILYWSKTNDKAGPATLLTECGPTIFFDEREEGILFRGSPANDAHADTGLPVQDGDVCGKFLNEKRFVDIQKGELKLTITCKRLSDDFSINPRNYIAAKDTPYEFQISESEDWSFFGQTPAAPEVPKCIN